MKKVEETSMVVQTMKMFRALRCKPKRVYYMFRICKKNKV
jgi:hypothetical protein